MTGLPGSDTKDVLHYFVDEAGDTALFARRKQKDGFVEMLWSKMKSVYDIDFIEDGRRGVRYGHNKPLTLAARERKNIGGYRVSRGEPAGPHGMEPSFVHRH